MRKTWEIPGGIHPPAHKQQSTGTPILSASIPAELILPLSQYDGSSATPSVVVGQQVLKGQIIAVTDEPMGVPLHASTSGEVIAIEPRPIAHTSSRAVSCIVIRCDSRDEWIDHHGIDDYTTLPRDQLLAHLRDAGIAGLGGAGFPTVVKLRHAKAIDTLILNGAECEPYITADEMLMRERADAVIAGAKILQHLVQPTVETLIGIEDSKPEAIAALRQAAAGTGIEVVVFPSKYPSGGEKQLIQILTGREVPSGGLPADIGIICQNVGTAVAIHRAVVHGEPLISRITTVTGDACRESRNYEVLLGTPLQHLLKLSDYDAGRCDRLVVGGSMMGVAVDNVSSPVTKTTHCVLAATAAELPPPTPAQACIRCGHCADVCPATLLPQQLYWFARSHEWQKLEAHQLFDCIECGACAYVCPSHIPLVQYYRAAKDEIHAQREERAKAVVAKARFEARNLRIARDEAEKETRRQARMDAAKLRGTKEGPQESAENHADVATPTTTESPSPVTPAPIDVVKAAVERAKAKKAALEQKRADERRERDALDKRD